MPDQDRDPAEPGLVDFALAAYRDGGRWEVQELTQHHLVDVETLAGALRRLPGEAGALALVATDDDVFVLVRVLGADTRVLLSDGAAADDWELADDVLDFLDDDGADEADDEGRYLPPGDLDLLSDLGVSVEDLLDLVNEDDDDLDAVDLLADLADQLGFGPQFDDAVGLTPA